MNTSAESQPLKSRTRIRMDARLDAATRAKVDELAAHSVPSVWEQTTAHRELTP